MTIEQPDEPLPPKPTDRDDMAGLRAYMAALAQRVAADFEVPLPESEASIPTIEGILGQLHDDYRTTGSDEGLHGLGLAFGAHLVTVIDRLHGPVRWERDHPALGDDSFPLHCRGRTLFPVGWCLKRIFDGPGEDLPTKWATLLSPGPRGLARSVGEEE